MTLLVVVLLLLLLSGPAVVYDAASPVYDDVFFAVNSKKNEKSITSHRNVSLCRYSIPLNCLQTALTVAMNNDWI